jgi:hypothetical protein
LNTTSNDVEQVREQARALYKKIEANSSKNYESIRGDVSNLAASLQKLAMDQRDKANAYLANAASQVQAAPADQTELRERMRDALQSISQAVAAARSKSKQQA